MHELVRNGFVRNGFVAVAGLAAALALTGCGGGGSDDKGGDPGKDKGGPDTGGAATAGPSPGSGTDSGTGSGSGAGTPAEVEGAWLGRTDGKAVNLTIKKGHAVVLADSRVCQGTAKGADGGKVVLALKCHDGSTDRASGSAETSDGRKIVVTWDSGKKDTLAKSPLGEDLPTSLPSLPTQP
ncbi:hypothetical protein [Streptomyces sp. NRRL S-118]|uniref:hypothetical protein n=1 Tax=Streptomyces sp. NRRL S-118 TaxID=1463881 RepID=UPI000AAB0C27|nr:hypothetical protein [Streptomyces sp. NRRL S-118]